MDLGSAVPVGLGLVLLLAGSGAAPPEENRFAGPPVAAGAAWPRNEQRIQEGVPPRNASLVSADIVDMVQTAPEAPEVRVRAIEVNQAVQDWLNSVPLVAGKPTLVRVFLEAPADRTAALPLVKGRLMGFRGGTELPFSPLEGTVDEFNEGLRVTEDASKRRPDPSGSLNFVLPEPWTRGPLTLQFAASNVLVVYTEPAEPNGEARDGIVHLEFLSMPDLPVRFHLVTEVGEDGTETMPGLDQVVEVVRRMTSQFPVERLRWGLGYSPVIRSRDIREVTDFSTVLDQLKASPEYLSCPQVEGCELRQAILPVTFRPETISQNGRGVAESLRTLLSAARLVSGSFCGDAPAHELGHCLGLEHTFPASAQPVLTDFGLRYFPGTCGEKAFGDVIPFPYYEDIPLEGLRPVLGPLGLGEDRKAYGATTEYRLPPGIANPTERFELMSYCDRINPVWISEHSYRGIKDAILQRYGGGIANPLNAGPPSRHLVIRGSIDLSNQAVSLLPLRRVLTATSMAMQNMGSFALELLGPSGNLLQEYAFEPILNSNVGVTAGFFFVIPDPSELRRMRVRQNGATILENVASANPPTVEVTFPNGGETIDAGPLTVRWAGSDPDGDALHYFVEYSWNGGANWEALAVDWPEKQCTIPKDRLRGGENLRVRVEATDGFWSTFDSSNGSFRATDNQPHVFLLNPTGWQTLVPGHTLTFEATTLDAEDGNLPEASVSWTSDLDGPIGTGLKIDRAFSEMSRGTHKITVSATDSAGNRATGTTMLNVALRAPPRVSDLRFGEGDHLGFQLFSGLAFTNLIETSTDLAHWQPILTNIAAANPTAIRLSRPSEASEFFVRAVAK